MSRSLILYRGTTAKCKKCEPTRFILCSFTLRDPSGSLVQSAAFDGIPIDINSRAQIILNPSLTSENLQLDVNGDGTVVYAVQANQLPPPASYASTLITIIQNFNLPQGTESDLTSVLRAAVASLQRGDTTSAANQIGAFQSKVAAQTGKKLTATQANLLQDLASKSLASMAR